jgi:hypothetical protein
VSFKEILGLENYLAYSLPKSLLVLPSDFVFSPFAERRRAMSVARGALIAFRKRAPTNKTQRAGDESFGFFVLITLLLTALLHLDKRVLRVTARR